ncbi:MAG: DUF885 domain-containing protein [Erysipelotrichaceae bacterium]|nr:DUF885 domain-containing protein [Erysipelotrichaceae bacterium]
MKKLLIIMLAAAMLMPMAACKKKPEETGNPISSEEFKALMLEWFKEDIASDYIDLHFALEHPEKYGIIDVKVTLGEIESSDEDIEEIRQRVTLLEGLSQAELTEDQKIALQTLLAQYRNSLDWDAVENDYSFAFTPNSGINNNLTTTFMEFVPRNEQEVKDLIELVKDSKRYIADSIAYTKDQFADGIVQTDEVIDAVVDQVKRFISKREDNEVIRTFNENIEELNLANEAEYKAQMRDAVLNYLIPAYEDILTMYDEIRGSGKAKGPIANYGEEGKRFYELLFRSKSSSSTSVSEWEKTLKKAIEDLLDEEIAFVRKNYTTYLQWIDGDYSYGLSDAYEIFTALKQKLVADFPMYPEVDYTISYLDPSVTSENVAAYYLIAPYDNMNFNVVKANPAFSDNDANGYVVTLAHEGYPGHLYQNTYYFTTHPDSEIRYVTDFIGYTEGWAMYAEQYAMKYFAPTEKLAYLDSLDNQMSYYMEAYLDILINYEGYDVSQIADALDDMGFNGDAAGAVYDTLLGDPAVFVSYALGLYQMLDLQKTAQDKLGIKYNAVEFNKVLLDTGATTFEILGEQVDKYISEHK